MPQTPALSTSGASDPIVRTTIERREPRPDDVVIDIAYVGICHSDISHSRSEWRGEIFPMVPGHEIAGTVAAVGPDVTKYQVGDRVGVGCMVNSCLECEYCRAGDEINCVKGFVSTYAARDYDDTPTLGGYSRQIVVREHFVLRIPDGVALDVVAPMMCAGITTYHPLHRWGAGPGKQVAVIGLGGLGHMGVKIGSALGAEVTVLSQSLKKQEDGLRFGASDYLATSDDATFENNKGRFDVILNTVSAKLPLDSYLPLLRVGGTLANVGAPPEPLAVNVFSLLTGNRNLSGSLIGGIPETQQMLDFCAEHQVGAEIETISADDVNEAYDRMLASDVRYRFVIDTSTIGG